MATAVTTAIPGPSPLSAPSSSPVPPKEAKNTQLPSPPPESLDDSENFWKVEADDSTFWHDYVSTRPNYSPSFYSLLYSHHAAHSTTWSSAHDVGCGAGQVAAELAQHFNHISASDLNATHVQVAERRLAPEISRGRVSLTVCAGEDLPDHHPAGSADLIAAAEAMVLMDEKAALKSFATVLKPGGTLAFWFYGRPTFAEPEFAGVAQPLLNEIMVRNWSKVIRGKESTAARRAGFKRAADGMASWLDFVEFDPETWIDVKRIKWNRHGVLPFFGEEACGFPVEAVSKVQEGEELVEHVDPDFWRNDWTIADLKKYFSVLFPGFKEAIGDGDSEIDRLFRELEEKIGGPDAVRKFTWPAVLVLATRR